MAKKVIAKREVAVVTSKYELMLILNPELRESDVDKKLKEITDMIEKADGKILHEDSWGKRDLAYRIKGNRQGYYMVYNLELTNVFIAELREHLRIDKEVVRSMLIKLDDDHVYTKYDLTAEPKEERRPSRPESKRSDRNVSIKHNSTITPPKKKEEVKEKKEDKKDVNEKELDKKLDEIIGGEDLNL